MLPASHVRISLQFKLHQERIKTCNLKQKTFFKKLFKGYWRCPALSKNQSGQLPEPSNSPRNWQKLKNISKPNASHQEFFGTIEEIVRNPAKGMSSLLHHSNMSHFHHVRSKPFVPVTTATGIPSANCGN